MSGFRDVCGFVIAIFSELLYRGSEIAHVRVLHLISGAFGCILQQTRQRGTALAEWPVALFLLIH
jgi:hypothetical protein